MLQRCFCTVTTTPIKELIMPDPKEPAKSTSSDKKKATPSKSKAKPASGSHATPAKKAEM